LLAKLDEYGAPVCGICLEDLDALEVITLPCDHKIHLSCYEQLSMHCGWAALCPYCRAVIP